MNTTDKPTLQEFDLPGVKHVTPEIALAAIENNQAIIVDVREENEIRLQHIPAPNIHYHPMSSIMERVSKIAKDQEIFCLSQNGERSSKVANLFNRLGYPNIANVDGGLKVWKARNLPYESVFTADSDCGCNCSSCGDDSCK